MSDRLKGKRAFVTAGAAGIGRASAIAFAREGATVFATDIDEKGLAQLSKDGVAEVARLDVRDSAAVAEMSKRVGKVDILLNAAGFVHNGTALDCSDEDWDFSFDLNVKSMHRTIRGFLPGMLQAGHGSIVNISSAAGVFKAAPNPNAAKLFQNYCFTPEAQQIIIDVGGLRSLHPQVKEHAGRKPLAEIKLMKEDAESAEKQSEEIKARYLKIFHV